MTYVLSNLDFEYTWARWEDGAGGKPPRQVMAVARRWEAIMRLVAPGAQPLRIDTVTGAAFPSDQPGRRLLAWGWTPPVVQRARRHKLRIHAPPLEVVRRVNSKVFSHRLEKRLGLSPPGARLVDSPSELKEALCHINGPWLIKHPWGVSGRRQRRGFSTTMGSKVAQWATSVFAQGTPLVVEPLLEIEDEFSLHFDIINSNTVDFIGVCHLMTDRRGTFRGIGVEDELIVPDEMLTQARKAAYAVADEGYFGPLGIDAMIADDGQRSIVRPLTELNARYSFGRLGLALYDRLCGPEGRLLWHHPPQSESPPQPLGSWPTEWRAGRFRLPDDVDPEGRSGTWVQLEASERKERSFSDSPSGIHSSQGHISRRDLNE